MEERLNKIICVAIVVVVIIGCGVALSIVLDPICGIALAVLPTLTFFGAIYND